MSDLTLADPCAAGKAAAEALAERIGLPIEPWRARRRALSGRRDVLVAADGRRAWWLGPLIVDDLDGAARVADPVARLARIAPGGVDAVYRLAALSRGIAFVADFDGFAFAQPRPPPPRHLGRIEAAVFRAADGSRFTVIAPPTRLLLDRLDHLDAADEAVILTTPRRLEAALQRAVAGRTMTEACGTLQALDPDLSARGRPSRLQRGVIVAIFAALPVLAFTEPAVFLTAAHVASAVSFVSLGYVRALALAADRPPPPPPAGSRDLPGYTVLVALFREAHMVEGLLAALDRLDYPRDRLEIRLLLEQEDVETIAAAERAVRHRPGVAIAICPPGAPRTKPRALAFGLVFANGEIVTVFDAEDRPHPGQLRAAVGAFAAGPEHLACVQARLSVDRVRTGIQRQFAIEYAVLFDGILPWLGRRALPMPLGGTSNHFRRDALATALGWDPWNVTEDADLGIRLMRYGFTVDVVDSETAEEAPATVAVWLRQRRRWIKGWIVTSIVHLRRPRTLAREIGWRNTGMIVAHLLANVGAPLAHPFGLAILVLTIAGVLPLPLGRSFADDLLFAASTLSVVFAYGAGAVFTRRLLLRRGRRDLARSVWWMPLYWLLASVAAWRAIVDLVVDPHHWAKTPHVAREEEEGEEGE
jgi:cellulose synthase/poly-beta-1,6-N-acetylglucosamine synthase-like glycosyltransferase